MYAVANFGPIEIGRVTVIPGPLPYYATVNAVAVKMTQPGAPCTPQLPESVFRQAFADFYAAEAFATSFFPATTQSLIQWTIYRD